MKVAQTKKGARFPPYHKRLPHDDLDVGTGKTFSSARVLLKIRRCHRARLLFPRLDHEHAFARLEIRERNIDPLFKAPPDSLI